MSATFVYSQCFDDGAQASGVTVVTYRVSIVNPNVEKRHRGYFRPGARTPELHLDSEGFTLFLLTEHVQCESGLT